RLAQEIGESIYLSVRHGDSAQYIDAALGGAASQRLNWEGREFPLQTTAAGLALLGTIPEYGFIMVDSSLEDDMTAIAAPVLLGGFPVAALSAVVLSEHLNNHTRQLWGSQIAREAQQLSADPAAAPSRRAPRSIETVRRRTA
ncbi:IclR family transcriptional regulator, partial [Amycolatopsis sp. H6(2020)]|nr:IclR family transcriptional regulator [Amycolatopsis sp. H6(2020)]